MHELSIAHALVEQVDALIDQHGAKEASLIRVRIGPLSGVVPELLESAFTLTACGSRMENARLEFTHTAIEVQCEACGAETTAEMNHLVCSKCGDWHTKVISGDELLLERVELETPTHQSV